MSYHYFLLVILLSLCILETCAGQIQPELKPKILVESQLETIKVIFVKAQPEKNLEMIGN